MEAGRAGLHPGLLGPTMSLIHHPQRPGCWLLGGFPGLVLVFYHWLSVVHTRLQPRTLQWSSIVGVPTLAGKERLRVEPGASPLRGVCASIKLAGASLAEAVVQGDISNTAWWMSGQFTARDCVHNGSNHQQSMTVDEQVKTRPSFRRQRG